MKKYLIALLFSTALLCLASVTVGAETTLDVAEQYIQRMQFYEQANEKAAPVSSTEAGVESVNNANGGLVYSQTDLTLPGKNGLDVNITRELNSSLEDYEYLTITPIKDSYSKKTTNKYIYKYFVENDTSRPVFIAYDTPQAMFEKENGTNTIQVSSNYTSYIKFLSTNTENLGYQIDSTAVALGITFNSSFYYANDLPEGEDVTLYRDLNSGCGKIYIDSIHAYGFSTRVLDSSSMIADNWDTRPSSIQYTPTRAEVWGPDGDKFHLFYGNLYFPDSDTLQYYCINGIVYDRWDDVVTDPVEGTYRTKANGNGNLMVITGDNVVNVDTQETFRLNIVDIRRECTWEFVDRGIFYDTLNGMALDYKLEYSMNFAGSISDSINCVVYNYLPRPLGNGEYYSQRSDMYSLQMQQSWADDDMVLTFQRYDGTSFEFVVDRNSAGLTDGSSNVINANMNLQTIPVSKVSDNYGNTIGYNILSDDIRIIDTLGREINVRPSGIYVNGEQAVVYEMGTENDSVIDPNNKMDEDNADVLTVTYPDTGKEYKYYVKHYMDTYLMGGEDEGDNPFDLTKSTSVRKLVAVELPTGGRINYEYEASMDPVPMQPQIQKSTYKLAKRYETVSGSAAEINPIYYTHDYSDPDTRKATIHKGAPDSYSVTETYNEEGYLTESTVTSTESNNAYYTTTSYEYMQQNEGNFLPVKETTTVKSSSAASGAQTTVIESEYNERQQLTAQKRDGEYVLSNAYNDTYGVMTGSFQKRDDNLWVGTRNSLTSDYKDIAVSYAAERESLDNTWETHEGTSYTYTENGDLASVTQQGVTTNYTYSYTNYANTATAAKANSVTKTAQISNVGNIVDDNAAGANTQNLVTSETYDWLGRLVTATDANQNTTTYEYDSAGRVTKQTNPDATTVTAEYDDTNNTITTTAEDGAKQRLAYDPIGRDTAGYVYHAETQNWLKMYENSYDSQSRLSARTVYNDDGTEKSRITYTYFSDSQPSSETVLEGNTVLSKKEYVYEPYSGTNESAVSAKVYSSDNGYLTATQYTDKYGYRTRDTVSYDTVTNTQSYTTDLLGNILTVKDFKANAEGAFSPTVTYTYDYANRQTQVTTIAGTVTSSYDTYGRLASETDARGNSTYYTYNAAGWVTQVRVPMDDTEEEITNTYYDANGNTARTEVKQEGTKYNVTKNFYDSRNRLTAAVSEDADGSVITKYEYDDAGRITKQAVGLASVSEAINPETHKVTSYSYDSLGRMVSSTDPLGQQSTFQYSILGELLSETDRNGVVKTYDYDGLGRLKELSADGDTEAVSYVYDLMGNITQMVDGEGTTAYTYSKKGELLSETRSGVTKNYGYDANGNRTSFTVPAMGISATYGYDAIGRMTSFTDSGTTTSYTYDGNGNLLSETTDGGRTVTYSYNKANLLTSKTNKMGANTLETYALTYYADGNVKNVTENGVAKSYTYDGIGRLTKETTADAVTQYAYDKYNNRTGKQVYDSQNVLQSETAYTYDKNNRLTEIVEEAGDATYYTELSYDKNGNRIMEMLSGTTTASGDETPSFGISGSSPYVATYSYDVLGRMTSMAQGDTTASYTYDGAGLRQSKTVDGVTTSFVLDGMYVAAETSGETSTYYSRGVNLISRSTGESKDYYYMNSHGDVTKLVNSSGTVVVDYTYDAFGNQTSETEDSNPFRYAGEYWDSESGLIYLRARYYDSGVGGFVSEDPAKDGLNWYSYCAGNPVNGWDPTGLEMAGDEQYSELKQTMLRYLGKAWNKANAQSDRDKIHQVAENLRNFDDSSFNRLIYMNDSDGALNQGHAGILLLNSAGEGLLFSFYPTSEGPEVLNVAAEMRFAVLSNEEAYSLIKVNGEVEYAAASDGDIVYSENYDRFAYYDITNDEGIKMFNEGAWLFDNPGTYNLLGRQCDNIANQIMSAGGYGYEVQWNPNETYDMLSKGRASWSL